MSQQYILLHKESLDTVLLPIFSPSQREVRPSLPIFTLEQPPQALRTASISHSHIQQKPQKPSKPTPLTLQPIPFHPSPK